MAFAGGLGARIVLSRVPRMLGGYSPHEETVILLFSESNTRFLCEVPPEKQQEFENILAGVPHAVVGEVSDSPVLSLSRLSDQEASLVIDLDIHTLKEAWQAPLRW